MNHDYKTNDEQNMSESHFGAVMKRYQNVRMNPEEKREVFKQTMLVIEKIEAVSLAHGDLHKAMRPTSAFVEDESLILGGVAAVGNREIVGSGQKGIKRVASIWLSYVKQKQFMPALLTAFVFLFTGGASVLAERSLPGDSLYSFKVNINEPIREFAAVGTEAKANVAVEATERRLQEAAALSAKGKLDESNTKILASQFSKNATQVRNQVGSLSAANDELAAAEISDKFAITLQAHSKILGTLAAGDAGSAGIAATMTPSGSASSTLVDLVAVPTVTPTSTDPITPTSTLAVIVTASPSSTPPVGPVAGSVIKATPAPVNSLLQAVKAELDTTKTARDGIDAQTNATVANTAADQPSQATKAVIDSMIQGIRFSMTDISSELDAQKFDPKAFAYAPNTIEFAKKRMDNASGTIAMMNDLVKANSYAEAIKKGRALSRSLSEVLVVLKIEKSTKGTLDGKLNVTSLIQDATAGDATSTPAL